MSFKKPKSDKIHNSDTKVDTERISIQENQRAYIVNHTDCNGSNDISRNRLHTLHGNDVTHHAHTTNAPEQLTKALYSQNYVKHENTPVRSNDVGKTKQRTGSTSDISHTSIHLHQGYIMPLQNVDQYVVINTSTDEKPAVYAPVPTKHVQREGGLFSTDFMKRAIVMSLWFFCSFASIVLNKYILSTLNVDAGILGETQILMTTFFAGIMMYLPICKSMKNSRKHPLVKKFHFFKTISILGCLRCGAVICSVIGLKNVAVSFSETIKSSAPLFTAIVAYFLLGEYSGMYVNLSLIPIMFGLAVSTSTEISFNMTGFIAAITNNVLDCIQNVFSKKLLSDSEQKYSPLELQFYTSVAATIVQLPIYLILLNVQSSLHQLDQYTISILLFNSVVFYAQSLFAYLLMSLISPVTFSVSNTVKRAGLIWFSILVFGNSVTLLNAFGTILVVAGVFLYQRARLMEAGERTKLMEEKKVKRKIEL